MSSVTRAEQVTLLSLDSSQRAALSAVGIHIDSRVDEIAKDAISGGTPIFARRASVSSTDTLDSMDTHSTGSSVSIPEARAPFSDVDSLKLGSKVRVAPSIAKTEHISSSEQTWQPHEATKNRENLAKTFAALKSIHENETDPTRHRLMTMELVSKALVYSDLPFDSTVSIPMMRPKEDGTGLESVMVKYRVLVQDLGNGNLAYIFKPVQGEKASPIIAFRGTCPSDKATIRSSLGVRALLGVLTGFWSNIGAREVASNKDHLERIIQYLREEYPGEKTYFNGS